jgi:transcriptional regulator with XRE-family HTH domain
MKRPPSLAAYLKATKKTQNQLAAELGIPQSQVSMYVSGRQMPRAELALKIQALTGVSVESLLRARAERQTRARRRVGADESRVA